MKCKCGADNLPDAQFCAHCGTALPEIVSETTTKSGSVLAPVRTGFAPRSARARYLRLLIGIVVGLGVAMLYWWSSRPDPDYVVDNGGLYEVRVNNKVGFIDRNGTLVIPAVYDSGNSFNEGLAPVSQQGKWGYIDAHGVMVIEPQFDFASWFVNAMAPVQIGSGSNARWGIIGRNGKYLINPQFKRALFFTGGLAAVEIDGTWGFVDKAGTMIIKPHFGFAGAFSEGMAPVAQSGKWGYIDKAGNDVVKPQFDSAGGYSDGVAAVQSGGKYGYIDGKGKFVINPQFDTASSFSHGVAMVKVAGNFGLIDKSGKFVLNPGQADLPLFDLGDGVLAAKSANGFGYIDKSGNWLVSPTSVIEQVGPMRGGIAQVRITGEDCYINTSGMVIWGVFKGKSLNALENERKEKEKSQSLPTPPLPAPLPSVTQSTSALPPTIPMADGFSEFYARFRMAVRRRDTSALQALMATRFEWALDGYTTRDEALKNIGQIFGWGEFWQSAGNAVAKEAEVCRKPYCNNRPGYRTWAGSRVPLEMMFERDRENQWRWTAVLGD